MITVDVANIKIYAGFLMSEADGLCDKLNKARSYYATMLADGADLLDDNDYLYNVEEGLSIIGDEIFRIMRTINRFMDKLPEEESDKEGKSGEEV